MKKTILILTVALASVASAQTSNLLSYVNTGSGANTGTGDPMRTAFGKINGDFMLLSTIVDSNTAAITALQTNSGAGGGGVTNFVLTVTNLPAGSAATATNTGVVGGIAYVTIGIPAGSNGVAGSNGTNGTPGTNIITAYNLTNSVLQSHKSTTFATNNITWGTSNFLARVAGLWDWSLNYGVLGGSGQYPPTNVWGQLSGSYTGTNGWFVLTNGFTTTNTISVSSRSAGGGLGFISLFAIDHPELVGRTNWMDYQTIGSSVAPTAGWQFVNKDYVDTSVAILKSGNFASSSDTNGVYHYSYSVNGTTVFDLWNSIGFIPIISITFDGTGTNVVLAITQTNLMAGYSIQTSTNILLGSAGFTTFTNYILSTNSGVVSFTTPLNGNDLSRFYRAIYGVSAGVNAYSSVAAYAGTLYPSNTWSFSAITNTMSDRSYWTGSSNGAALVTLWRSNSAVYYIVQSNAVSLKIPAP